MFGLNKQYLRYLRVGFLVPTLIIPSPLIFDHPYCIIKWTVATWSLLIGQGLEPCVFEGYSVRFELAVEEEAFIFRKFDFSF